MIRIFKPVILLVVIGSSALIAVAQTQTAFPDLDDASGWQSCGKSCAGGNGTAIYSMTQGVASPSEDGASTKFSIAGKTGYSNALWWLHVGNSTTATNFTLDTYQYVDNPAAAQALEYSTTQYYNGAWYKFSFQCSFSKAIWRVWDSYHKAWVATTIPCIRPLANTWSHLTFQTQRSSGRALFVSLTIDGQTWYINKSFKPNTSSSGQSGNITIHYQLDGNKYQTPYNAYLDDLSLTIW